MLAIRNDHIDNHFSDKFVPLCHVNYFINDDRCKLTVGCIFIVLFTFFWIKFCIFIFQGYICQQVTHSEIKMSIYPILNDEEKKVCLNGHILA